MLLTRDDFRGGPLGRRGAVGGGGERERQFLADFDAQLAGELTHDGEVMDGVTRKEHEFAAEGRVELRNGAVRRNVLDDLDRLGKGGVRHCGETARNIVERLPERIDVSLEAQIARAGVVFEAASRHAVDEALIVFEAMAEMFADRSGVADGRGEAVLAYIIEELRYAAARLETPGDGRGYTGIDGMDNWTLDPYEKRIYFRVWPV